MYEMKSVIKIDGMTCDHCVGRVEKGLANLPGVEKVKVKLKKGEATVKYDDTEVTLPELVKIINEIGYEAH